MSGHFVLSERGQTNSLVGALISSALSKAPQHCQSFLFTSDRSMWIKNRYEETKNEFYR